jgi:nucleotide-binding universal stress UspA family protein
MTDIPKISRVLVGMDFDDASAAALTMASALASACTAELTVLHAVTEAVPAYFTRSQFTQLEAERQQSRAAVAERLRIFAERQVATPVHVVVGEGPAQDAIVRLAPAFDLIVVGTHRRHGPQRWWLGSVAEAVVRQSPRPVLVVAAEASVPNTRRPPRILVAGRDGAAVDVWGDVLRTAFGGIVLPSLEIQQCSPDRMQQADLIVLPMPSDHSDSQLNVIAHVLKECVHPVLFVPSSEGIVERSLS